MIRHDGKFTIYKIQHRQNDGQWVYSRWGEPEITPVDDDTLKEAFPDLKDVFTASGRCWQYTGIHGVFNLENAKRGLIAAAANLARDYTEKKTDRVHPLRLVKVEISQKTTAL